MAARRGEIHAVRRNAAKLVARIVTTT